MKQTPGPAPPPEVAASLAALGVPRETLARLVAFVGLLLVWTRRINLVGSAEAPRLWQRHILDSAQLVPLLPEPTRRIADLGSGAGLPGFVLAIVTGIETHLVESDRRKVAFLQEAARVTGARVRVHAARAEMLAPLAADLVTARALAPLPRLLALAWRHLAPGGTCLFLKGAAAEAELTAAATAWTMRVERFASLTDPDATILRLGEVAPVHAPSR